MSRYNSPGFPKRFQIGSVYRSTRGAKDDETLFVVLEVKSHVFWTEPAEYWALDLITGEKFGFHRASRLAVEAAFVA